MQVQPLKTHRVIDLLPKLTEREEARREAWRSLPYGRYICEDSYVVFNRSYRPLFRVYRNGRRELCDGSEWIKHIGQQWFYDDRKLPSHNAKLRGRLVAIRDGKRSISDEDIINKAGYGWGAKP